MRLLTIITVVSVILWVFVLSMTGPHVRSLAETNPELLNPARFIFYVGLPVAMILLATASIAAMRYIERTAESYDADYSHRLAPVPVLCLLLFLPYLFALFIIG